MQRELDIRTPKFTRESVSKTFLYRNESLNGKKFALSTKREVSHSVEKAPQVPTNYYSSSMAPGSKYPNSSSPKKIARPLVGGIQYQQQTEENKQWGKNIQRFTGEYYSRCEDRFSLDNRLSTGNKFTNPRSRGDSVENPLNPQVKESYSAQQKPETLKNTFSKIGKEQISFKHALHPTEGEEPNDRFIKLVQNPDPRSTNTFRNEYGYQMIPNTISAKRNEGGERENLPSNTSINEYQLREQTVSSMNRESIPDESTLKANLGMKRQPMCLKRSPSQFDSSNLSATIEALNNQMNQIKEERDRINRQKNDTESYYKGIIQRLNHNQDPNPSDYESVPTQIESERKLSEVDNEKLNPLRNRFDTGNRFYQSVKMISSEREVQNIEQNNQYQRIMELEKENKDLKEKVSDLDLRLKKNLEDYSILNIKYKNLRSQTRKSRNDDLEQMIGSSSTIPRQISSRREDHFADNKKTTSPNRINLLIGYHNSEKSIHKGSEIDGKMSNIKDMILSPSGRVSVEYSLAEQLETNKQSMKNSLVLKEEVNCRLRHFDNADHQNEVSDIIDDEDDQVVSVDMQKLE